MCNGDANTWLGYASAFLACLAMGSFAVPIKRERFNTIDVDPMVLQTYKVLACFLSSFLILLVEPLSFTPWGIVSGFFMFPGGTAGYFAVRTAGLAVSQGIWSTIKVLVSFLWGIFVFNETVHSFWLTLLALILASVGLLGMSFFARPEKIDMELVDHEDDPIGLTAPLLGQSVNPKTPENDIFPNNNTNSGEHDDQLQPEQQREQKMEGIDEDVDPIALPTAIPGETGLNGSIEQPQRQEEKIMFRIGVLAAVFDGVYGGSVLVPIHYNHSDDTQGLQYVISFGIGCLIAAIMTWTLRLAFLSLRSGSIQEGWNRLPSFHWSTLGPSAMMAGLLWSIGNVGSILSVYYLGQAIGYSLAQSQLLVAGLWGILYYQEIRTQKLIMGWFICALVTIVGMLLLAEEHQSMMDDECV